MGRDQVWGPPTSSQWTHRPKRPQELQRVKEERCPGQEVGILSVGAEMRSGGGRERPGRGPQGAGREVQPQWGEDRAESPPAHPQQQGP